jgi:GT2 family glycosyltransferase
VLDDKPSIGMVYTNYRVIDELDRDLGLGRRCQIPYSKTRMLVDFCTFHFRLIRKSVFDQVGGIGANQNYCYEYDLCLRLSEVTQVQKVPTTLYFYRKHSHQISSTAIQEQQEAALKVAQAALRRRKMQSTHELELTSSGKFRLRRR